MTNHIGPDVFALANTAFKRINEQNAALVEAVLKPLQDQATAFQETINAVFSRPMKAISESLKTLDEQSQSLRQMIADSVAKSVSYSGVLRNLALPQTGTTHAKLKKVLEDLEIDTDHFLGQRANSGKNHIGGRPVKTKEEVLVLKTSGPKEKCHVLRRALLDSGREYRCELCSQGPEWNGKELRLQVDHRNGNKLDDRAENLRFLCPNCHCQTSNWGTGKLSDLTSRSTYFRERRKRKKEE